METQFHYDITGSKQLSFRLRQRVTKSPGLEIKAKGLLNTSTSNLDYVGSLKKYVFVGNDSSSLANSTGKRIGTTPTRLGRLSVVVRFVMTCVHTPTPC